MNKFKDLCKSGYWLWKETNLPKRTIYDLYQGHAEFKYMRVHNALKISKALNMSIEEIYEYLYEYDEKNCDD